MQSTFMGIEIGKRSLVANNQAIAVIGHNLSNASTPGYNRQRIKLKTIDPLYLPQLNREMTPGQIGQGVVVDSIKRIHDEMLESRIVEKSNLLGYWKSRDKYLEMLEQVYNEPEDISVRGAMDRFWNSWQDLSNNPSQMAVRKTVLESGTALIDSIHNRYANLKTIRDILETDVQGAVKDINEKITQIAALNEQIVKIEAMKDNPNDILDRRDVLVQELSEIIDITIDNRDPDEFTIHTGGFNIVQGRIYNPLVAVADPKNEGYSKIIWKENGDNAYFRGGKLNALLEMRDVDVKEEIQTLDSMTMNFVDLVNEIHRKGYGLNEKTNKDFFVEYPFINNIAGNYDRNGDGVLWSHIFRISGTNELSLQEQVGIQGTMILSSPGGNIEINYEPKDTVEDIIKRINNSESDIVARIDKNGRLSLKAAISKNNPDFVLRHIEDSGQFLVGYAGILTTQGQNGAYKWEQMDAVTSFRGGETSYAVAPLAHPSAWVDINPEVLNDPGTIAAGFGENGRPAMPGDGSAALEIASLRNHSVMIGKSRSFDDYFETSVAGIGAKGKASADELATIKVDMQYLLTSKESYSGVNMDEELAQMIKFQHGYAAAARFITEIDKMIDTIINRMGV